MFKNSAEQLKPDSREEYKIEDLVKELASQSEKPVSPNETWNRIFPEGKTTDASEIVDYLAALSRFIEEHKKISGERNLAVGLKTALLEKVFNGVENLPALAEGDAGSEKIKDEESLKKFIFSFNDRYERYVKEELRGKWRHCGDGSRLFSAILRAYASGLETALISCDTYLLSSRLKESALRASDDFREEIRKEIAELESRQPSKGEPEKIRKECGHLAVRAELADGRRFIVDPTQKQFDSTLETFSVYNESDFIDKNGIIRVPKEEKGRFKSGQLTGADILILMEHEDIIS